MSNNTERKATQVEQGWRGDNKRSGRSATQVDEGWRSGKTGSKSRSTEVDKGWRSRSTQKTHKATEVDEGWRKEIANTLDPADIMSKATANFFPTLDEFKNAVEKLPRLESSKGNIYPILNTISKTGGESIILECADSEGNNVVAKVYYEPVNGAGSSISTRSLVLEYMGTEEGQRYTLAVTDIGLVEFGGSKYYFEIMPYCPSTDMSDDGAYSFEQIVDITKQLNEALHSIHKAGIIHRDIKPENLYILDGQVKLGDFGIAKNGALGHSNVTEHILGTEGYAAPETRRYIYNEKSDYYSLGVTLATLFEGHYIFDNMNFEMQALAQESEKLPLMRTDPNREKLENLLNGLCRLNARQRFGYEDVKRWLTNHDYTGGGTSEEWPKPFRMLGESYRDERSLFHGLSKDYGHWEEAKNMLYRKVIEQFFISFRTDLARSAQTIDDVYRSNDSDKGLAVFLKDLYAPGPIVWKGDTYKSLEEVGTRILSSKALTPFIELLQHNCISHWLANTKGITVDSETRELVDEIEDLSMSEPEVACFWFGNSFASQKTLSICNSQVTTIEELVSALFSNPNVFYQTDGYSKLLNRKNGADLYGFLYSFGYRELIEKEWEDLDSCDTFNKVTILFSMIEAIAIHAGVDPVNIRAFFVNYGPVGIASYTKRIAMQQDGVYKSLDTNGKRVLAKIAEYNTPADGNVSELFRAYSPLIDEVEKLRACLTDNPFCILTGAYDNKGVICTNLVGCFAFKIFDRMAPLGFRAFIEGAEGGKNDELQG